MPSGSVYGPTGAFGAPGPGSGGTYNAQGQYVPGVGTSTTTAPQTGALGGTPGQGTSDNPWGTTGTMFDPQNLNGGSSAALTTPFTVNTAKDYTTQQATQGPLYAGSQAVGGNGIGDGGNNGYGYLNPRDRVANSLFNFKLGGGQPNGMFKL